MEGAAAKWPLSYVYPPEIDVKNELLLSWERPVEGKATTTRNAKQRHKIGFRTEHLFPTSGVAGMLHSGVRRVNTRSELGQRGTIGGVKTQPHDMAWADSRETRRCCEEAALAPCFSIR